MPIVDDLDGSPPCIDDNHVDMPGASIDRILYQLLDNGSRALNDLASCYLVGYSVREKADNVHIGEG